MRLIIATLLLVGCTTTEPKVITEAHLAKWCFDEDPTQNCLPQKGFDDPMQCLQFIVHEPKLQDKGYWVCELDPTRSW